MHRARFVIDKDKERFTITGPKCTTREVKPDKIASVVSVTGISEFKVDIYNRASNKPTRRIRSKVR